MRDGRAFGENDDSVQVRFDKSGTSVISLCLGAVIEAIVEVFVVLCTGSALECRVMLRPNVRGPQSELRANPIPLYLSTAPADF